MKGGLQISPFYIFRSALPVNLVDGRDLNRDGDAFEIPSEAFALMGRSRIEAIGEFFNLFNSVNPSGFRTRVTVPTTGLPDPTLLQPTTYSGDFRRPEQRVGQLGVRFSF